MTEKVPEDTLTELVFVDSTPSSSPSKSSEIPLFLEQRATLRQGRDSEKDKAPQPSSQPKSKEEIPQSILDFLRETEGISEDDGEAEIIYSDEELIEEPDVDEDEYYDEDDVYTPEQREKWGVFKNACEEAGVNVYSAFIMYLPQVNASIFRELDLLTRKLTLEEIMEMTNKVRAVKPPLPQKPAPLPQVSEKIVETQGSGEEGATIHLQKGFTQLQIQEFIVRINAQFKEGSYKTVSVVTNDWDSASEPFMLIPAAKKLFAKYIEAGLLGCLVANGYHEAAKKMYCIAYIKGKRDGDNVVFKGMVTSDYKEKAARSLVTFTELMKKVKIEPKKKSQLEVSGKKK
jgi:hypothetical protein